MLKTKVKTPFETIDDFKYINACALEKLFRLGENSFSKLSRTSSIKALYSFFLKQYFTKLKVEHQYFRTQILLKTH